MTARGVLEKRFQACLTRPFAGGNARPVIELCPRYGLERTAALSPTV